MRVRLRTRSASLPQLPARARTGTQTPVFRLLRFSAVNLKVEPAGFIVSIEIAQIRFYRWVPLYPNALKSKLAFIGDILKTTSQSLLCYSA